MTNMPLPTSLPAAKPRAHPARPGDAAARGFDDALNLPRGQRSNLSLEAATDATPDPARLSFSKALETQAADAEAPDHLPRTIADEPSAEEPDARSDEGKPEEDGAPAWFLIPVQTPQALGKQTILGAAARSDSAADPETAVDDGKSTEQPLRAALPLAGRSESQLAATAAPQGAPPALRPTEPGLLRNGSRDEQETAEGSDEATTDASRMKRDPAAADAPRVIRQKETPQEPVSLANRNDGMPGGKLPSGVAVIAEQAFAPPVQAQPASTAVVATLGADASWAAYFRETQVFGAAPAANIKSLKIQLNPAELGMVTAHLRFSDDSLSVELHADTAEAHRQLSADADQIVRSLRALGIDVDKVTVHHQPQADGRPPSGQSAGDTSRGFGGTGGSGEGRGADSGRGNNGRQMPGDNHVGENHTLADTRAAARDGGGRYI